MGYRPTAAFVGHQGRPAAPVNGVAAAPSPIQPPSDFDNKCEGGRDADESCSNYQLSKTACNNVILLHTDLAAIQLRQHGPVRGNLRLFNREAHPKECRPASDSHLLKLPLSSLPFPFRRTKPVNLELQNSFLPASEEILAW